MTRINDPRSGLTPSARRVLAGAQQVVLEEGFGRLTLSSISKASGENVAAVKYYFGNKAGLVKVLLDTVIYDVVSELAVPEENLAAAKPSETLVRETRVLSQPSDALRIWYDLLPHALRDDRLLERVHASYETFFRLHLEQIAESIGSDSPSSRLGGLASLLSALSDGIAMHAIIAPTHFDMDEVLATLQVLLEHGLPALAESPRVEQSLSQ